MTPIFALFSREWRIARRIGGGASTGAMFFLILVTLMPFALGPDLALLGRLGPAILWIAALLSTLLGLDRLFQSDLGGRLARRARQFRDPARTGRARKMRGSLGLERAAARHREPAVRADAGPGRLRSDLSP